MREGVWEAEDVCMSAPTFWLHHLSTQTGWLCWCWEKWCRNTHWTKTNFKMCHIYDYVLSLAFNCQIKITFHNFYFYQVVVHRYWILCFLKCTFFISNVFTVNNPQLLKKSAQFTPHHSTYNFFNHICAVNLC